MNPCEVLVRERVEEAPSHLAVERLGCPWWEYFHGGQGRRQGAG